MYETVFERFRDGFLENFTLIRVAPSYISSAVFVVFLLSFWSSGSLHHRGVWLRSWRTPVVGFVAGISTVSAENSTLISWSLPTVCRRYPTILHMNNGTNSLFDELLSSLSWSIGIIVHRGIVGSRSIHNGIPVCARQLFHLPLKDTRFYHRKTKKTRAPCLYCPNSSASRQLLLRGGDVST